jgi:hypothetical protein
MLKLRPSNLRIEHGRYPAWPMIDFRQAARPALTACIVSKDLALLS